MLINDEEANLNKQVRVVTPTTASDAQVITVTGQGRNEHLGTVGEATHTSHSNATGDSYILIVEREKNMLFR